MLALQTTISHSKADATNIKLLRFAGTSGAFIIENEGQDNVVSLLNELPKYSSIHWRLFPIFKHKAKECGAFDKLEPSVQDLLNDEVKKAKVRELAANKQVELLVDKFNEAGIEIVFLKGVALNEVVYGEEVPRLSRDIDLLVRKKDWHKAKQTISEFMSYKEKIITNVLDDTYEVSYRPNGNIGAVVDLHCALVNEYLFDIDEEQLWNNTRTVELCGGKSILILSLEAMLIHQAIHAFKDRDFVKYGLVDTSYLLTQKGVDIEKAIKLAKEFKVTVPLYALLVCCKNSLKIDIDVKYIDCLKPNWLFGLFVDRFLRSSESSRFSIKKNMHYRLKQVFCQILFTQNMVSTVKLSIEYTRTWLKNCLKKLNDGA